MTKGGYTKKTLLYSECNVSILYNLQKDNINATTKYCTLLNYSSKWGQIGTRGTFYLTKRILLCFAGVHLVFPDFEEKERQVALNKLPIVRKIYDLPFSI